MGESTATITEAGAAAAKDRVRRYYIAATEDYLKYYQSDWHHHMHYGFDRDLPKGGNPTEHLVRYLAGVAGLLPPGTGPVPEGWSNRDVSQVLDAGCGVGGSGIWLARNAPCRCVGITLVEHQTRLAKGFAAAAGVAPKGPGTPGAPCARFAAMDFTAPAFKENSFDVVWAMESFDHAPDKRAWVHEMATLLKPGGRLAIADGFREEKTLDARQSAVYKSFLAGWAVPHLCTARELETWAAEAGLELVHGEDISADVMPHARAIFRFGLLFIPIRWLLLKLGWTSPEKMGNAVATYYQYLTFKRGDWTYRVFAFRKPF
jgi:SAM-dependent methyltransferase